MKKLKIKKKGKLGFGLGLTNKRPLLSVVPGFDPDAPTNELPVPKKMRLTKFEPLKTAEEVKKEKEEEAKKIIALIPSKKQDLFVFIAASHGE